MYRENCSNLDIDGGGLVYKLGLNFYIGNYREKKPICQKSCYLCESTLSRADSSLFKSLLPWVELGSIIFTKEYSINREMF